MAELEQKHRGQEGQREARSTIGAAQDRRGLRDSVPEVMR